MVAWRYIVGVTLVATISIETTSSAQVASTPQQPPPQQPAAQPPPSQPPAAPGTAQQPGSAVVPAPVVPVNAAGARTFTGPTGVIFNAVRPERVVDFELVIGYLQAALEKSTDARVREQARGWRMFKAAEPGPNGTVLYAFLIDPAVPGAEYALGPILSEAYPDQIEQIWKLYQGALAGAGSQTLLNLTPVKPPPLPPAGTAPTPTTPPADARPGPPPAN
jgi:hypothetical protein